MNTLKLVNAAILCMVLFSFFSVGCDKDKSPTKPSNDMALVGTWKVTKMSWTNPGSSGTYTESQLDAMGIVWTFKIEDDGTAEWTTNISGTLVTMPSTWSTSANQLTMTSKGPNDEVGSITFKYAIEGNILKLNWEMDTDKHYAEFTKQ